MIISMKELFIPSSQFWSDIVNCKDESKYRYHNP